ncbi:type I toxin-antitoxin system ptaRNA1 family toxin [Burkholderia pseudomultivorans]|uniref:Toxin of toxin-antitoxin type 1 system n=1 Tax=Burkholderia pseudomultivorans TaxID=1207504 RepID=A0A132E8Z0_9BURK|nr:type I toxin-antitoxin system ptaRNA1 family toxin [Burkholderia pseudomultivorans]KWF21669.1 toxin of toxin-antitoxin type 1 system [Burkholderia pseudomultivorans]
MATTHDTEARKVIHHTATQLAALDFMDQRTAKDLSKMAEAVANLLMVVFYQAETGRATRSDFSEAMTAVRQMLRQ